MQPCLDPRLGPQQRCIQTLDEPLERLVLPLQPDDHRIEVQCADHPAPVDGLIDHPVEQDFARTRTAGFSVVEGILERGHLAFGDRDDDLLFGPELPVDRSLRDSHCVRDHLQRGPAHAVLGDENQSRVQNPRLRGRAPDRAKATDFVRGRHSVRITND